MFSYFHWYCIFLIDLQGNTRDVVAIKCIQKSSLSKTATENLLTEIELLKKLDHEHIVKLKDFEVSVNTVIVCCLICFAEVRMAFSSSYNT